MYPARLLSFFAVLCITPQTLPASAQTVPDTHAVSAPEAAPYPVTTLVFHHVGEVPLSADIYIPKGPGPFPAILFLHGGGWSSGDRKQLHRQAAYMAERGFFGMAIDYRLAPANPYPAAEDDARSAVLWLRANADAYHVDATRIAAVGSSAGAHLAAMLGVESKPGSGGTGSRDTNNGDARVQAVVAFNGIYDLNTMPPTPMISDFTGKPCADAPGACTAASPIAKVGPGLPPMLLMHGTADATAPYMQAAAFADKLRAAGDPVTLYTVKDAPHTFWSKPQWAVLSDETMAGFLIEHLRPALPLPALPLPAAPLPAAPLPGAPLPSLTTRP